MRYYWDKKLRDFVEQRPRYDGKSANVMSDIQPFVSPIDRTEITSRSGLRAHEKTHGVQQVGNDLNSYYRDRLGRDF